MNKYSLFETAHGYAALAWNERGVTGFRLPAPTAEETRRSLLRRLPDAREAVPAGKVAALIEAVRRYFGGERVDFTDVPLDLGPQQPLFAKIYDLVRGLGYGETTTYGAVAKALGEGPEVARDGAQSHSADRALSPRAGGGRQDRRFFRAGRIEREGPDAGNGRRSTGGGSARQTNRTGQFRFLSPVAFARFSATHVAESTGEIDDRSA